MASWWRSGSKDYVICNQCGNSIYLDDLENFVSEEHGLIRLRCRNNCCGVADWYGPNDMISAHLAETVGAGTVSDLTNSAWLEF